MYILAYFLYMRNIVRDHIKTEHATNISNKLPVLKSAQYNIMTC